MVSLKARECHKPDRRRIKYSSRPENNSHVQEKYLNGHRKRTRKRKFYTRKKTTPMEMSKNTSDAVPVYGLESDEMNSEKKLSVIHFAPSITKVWDELKPMERDIKTVNFFEPDETALNLCTKEPSRCTNLRLRRLSSSNRFCSRCGYTCSNRILLKSHKCHFKPKSSCVVCGIQVTQDDYSDHVVSHSTVSDRSDVLDCAYCGTEFHNKTTLMMHYREHIAPYQCGDCKLNLMSYEELNSHVSSVHHRSEQQPYHCYICGRRFAQCEAIINHMRLHTGEAPFNCKECGRSFSQVGNLQRHINIHRGDRPHRCTQCECKFADPATLRNHLRTHTGELPYVCDVCRRGFSQVGNLKRHMLKHSKGESQDRPFRCPECGQGFAHESTLRNHYRTHTGEKPYRCTLCARAFSQIGNLKRHMAKHASEQGFLCGSCQVSFETARELVKHECFGKIVPVESIEEEEELEKDCRMITPWPTVVNSDSSHRSASSSSESDGKVKSASDDEGVSSLSGSTVVNRKWKIFPCKVCGKVYTWQHDLKIHFRVHSGEKPYNCDLCGKTFAQSGAIRTHKKRHHPGLIKDDTIIFD